MVQSKDSRKRCQNNMRVRNALIYITLICATLPTTAGNNTLKKANSKEIKTATKDRLIDALDKDSINVCLEPARPLYGEPDTLSILILGDMMLHSRQMEYDYKPFLKNIQGLIESSDIAVANMEFTLAGKPYSGYPAFSAPDAYAEYARDCGIDIFLTANNHIADKGCKGLVRTYDVYKQMEDAGQIRFTGISKDGLDRSERLPLTIVRKGISVALLNFTYGTNVPADKSWPVSVFMENDVREATSRAKTEIADFLIALPHWGLEYRLCHSDRQEVLATILVRNGADAVVGAHPHVVQDSCHIDGKPIFYSIGNAVSNMSAANTQLELAVRLRFTRDIDGDVRLLRPEAIFLWCSLPGKFSDNYNVIEVRKFLGKRWKWTDPSDYDKMVKTYDTVKKATGIDDSIE